VRRELGLALLERNEIGRATRRASAMRRRDVELALITMVSIGISAEIGMIIAWATLN
jgi:hypothetical protein